MEKKRRFIRIIVRCKKSNIFAKQFGREKQMIKEINIKNFKSIVDLTLDLGRFNVIIGANGCGKTNILEAIAFAAAANMRKLDNEFLINRDLRLAKPELMVNAFEEGSYEMSEGPLKELSNGVFYVRISIFPNVVNSRKYEYCLKYTCTISVDPLKCIFCIRNWIE